MDFALTEEQALLQETASAFVAKHCPAEQAKVWDETDHFPVDLWQQMADMGWFSLPYPLEAGGGGGSVTDLCILAEELGHASLDVAMAYVGTGHAHGKVVIRVKADDANA